jgi:transposase InsO family protein
LAAGGRVRRTRHDDLITSEVTASACHGFAERNTALLDGVVIDDTEVFNDKLREWENFYNYHRPHGGLGGQTPYERLKQRTQTRV